MRNKGIKRLVSLVIVCAMMFALMMPVGVAYAYGLSTMTVVTSTANPTQGQAFNLTISGSKGTDDYPASSVV